MFVLLACMFCNVHFPIVPTNCDFQTKRTNSSIHFIHQSSSANILAGHLFECIFVLLPFSLLLLYCPVNRLLLVVIHIILLSVLRFQGGGHHGIQPFLDGQKGTPDKFIVLQNQGQTWMFFDTLSFRLGRQFVQLSEKGIDVIEQGGGRIRKVMLMHGILGFAVTLHVGIVKDLLIILILGTERLVEHDIPHFGRDVARFLVKEHFGKVVSQITQFLVGLNVGNFAKGGGRRIVQESVQGKEERRIGRIAIGHAERLSRGHGLGRVGHAIAVVVVSNGNFGVRAVIELYKEKKIDTSS